MIAAPPTTAESRTAESRTAEALDLAVTQAFALAADTNSWRSRVCHVPGERWYTPLFVRDDASAWLITWAPGTGLPFHDHGSASGALAVVEGELVEQVSSRVRAELGLGPSHGNRLPAGSVHPLPIDLVHEVRNEGTTPAISIHVYAPRLDDMTFYDPTLAPRTGERDVDRVVADRDLAPVISIRAGADR